MSGFVRQLVADLRPLAAEFRAGADAYDVVGIAATGDAEGGWTETEATVESGYCILTAGNLRPDERVIVQRQGSVTPFVLRNLPWNTLLTERHIVRIAGRTFQIIGVLRMESANAAVTAICEEVN